MRMKDSLKKKFLNNHITVHHPERCIAKRATSVRKKNAEPCLPDIPSDLIPNILNKLPLKSLCRYKCVSKTWLSLIIKEYHGKHRRPILGVVEKDTTMCVSSIDGTTGIENRVCSSSHSVFYGSFVHFNGLFYFRDYLGGGLGVSNPFTQEAMLLPKARNYCKKNFNVNLGFDPLSNKYKILSWGDYPNCEIFTLGSDLWREITSIPPHGCGRPSSSLACIHGTMYWYSGETNKIISFHLGVERFGVIDGPRRVTRGRGGSRILHFFEFEGCVCLADGHAHLNTLDLWMLKDGCNSWGMIASIVPPSESLTWMVPYATRTGEVVLACDYKASGKILYLYSFITQQFDIIKLCGVGVALNFFLTDYVVNSVSLKDL